MEFHVPNMDLEGIAFKTGSYCRCGILVEVLKLEKPSRMATLWPSAQVLPGRAMHAAQHKT